MNQQMVDLRRDVVEPSFQQPVVVDFWAEWCSPCRMLGPILEKLAKQANGRWKLVKIDTETQPDIAMQFGIQSIPAVKMVYQGQIIAEFVGALPEAHVVRWLEENLPTKSKDALQQAMEALEFGDLQRAKQLLQYSVNQDENNLDAKVMLARILFLENPDKAIKLVEKVDEAHPMFDQVDAMRVLQRLMNSSKDLGKEAKQGHPEAWSLYLKGIDALKKRDFETALESWIESIIIDRKVDDDGARKACVSLFKILGNEHPLTQKYHRRFSSALF
ncbi:MAG: thioredoxin [candidate division KSB1 bacterium]|nr:thioredoxin [candidate division KSB1 bacterium]MDZ7336382.1 thioredoxin [candidate division KSB1 bacterium]MDZ7375830.1 thioredoxin [candidate division KSB1 bacterium]MDZ7401701.1 thioredoxin [candidate division KSB1 bacterium]